MSTWPDFNDMWDFGDPEGTEQKFHQILSSSTESENSSYKLQLQTQIARTYSLRKMLDEAHQLLDEVEEKMAGGDLVEVRYLLERGRSFNSAGEQDRGFALFLKASELGKEIGEDYYAIDALHMLGIASPPEEQMEWNLKAIDAAENSSDEHARKWLASLYNNTGWTLFDEEKYKEALELFEKALVFRQQQGNAGPTRIAKWCVGKALRALERLDEALEVQRELEADPEHDGFVEEEIAECLLSLGKEEESRPYFHKAFEALSQIDWVAEDGQRMQRLKMLGE